VVNVLVNFTHTQNNWFDINVWNSVVVSNTKIRLLFSVDTKISMGKQVPFVYNKWLHVSAFIPKLP
jgi:hypothetical protein